ncbi:hypothetical protein BGZ83_003737, partial [Gryganskiella cystojenkinii]
RLESAGKLLIRTSPKEYLDGDQVTIVHFLHPDEESKDAHNIGWCYSETAYDHNAGSNGGHPYLRIARRCLGILHGPQRCGFTQRPLQSIKAQHRKDGIPQQYAGECEICKKHVQFVHVGCQASWKIKQYSYKNSRPRPGTPPINISMVIPLHDPDQWSCFHNMASQAGQDFMVIEFKGPHSAHGIPPVRSPTFAGMQMLEALILASPKKKPTTLRTGSETRLPARFLDPLFIKAENFRKRVNKTKKALGVSTPLSLDYVLKLDLVWGTRLTHHQQWGSSEGFVSFMSHHMLDTALNTEFPFVADGVFSIYDHNFKSNAASVQFCSARGRARKAYQPVMISFLYSQDADAYKEHWYWFLKPLYESWDDLFDRFPGIVLDSDGSQTKGFCDAIKMLYPETAHLDIQKELGDRFKFCQFHLLQNAEKQIKTYCLTNEQKVRFRDLYVKMLGAKEEHELYQYKDKFRMEFRQSHDQWLMPQFKVGENIFPAIQALRDVVFTYETDIRPTSNAQEIMNR